VTKPKYKPAADHPWNRKIRDAAAKAKTRPRATIDLLSSLREEEELTEVEEQSEIDKQVREFFG